MHSEIYYLLLYTQQHIWLVPVQHFQALILALTGRQNDFLSYFTFYCCVKTFSHL